MGMQKGMTQIGALICSRPRDCKRWVSYQIHWRKLGRR